MNTLKEFEEAVARSRQLPSQSNENLLKLYALFKQATEGDIHIEKPSNPFDIPGNAKYRAWDALKGKTAEEAQRDYIDLVASLS